jgi:hypothetical protein
MGFDPTRSTLGRISKPGGDRLVSELTGESLFSGLGISINVDLWRLMLSLVYQGQAWKVLIGIGFLYFMYSMYTFFI